MYVYTSRDLYVSMLTSSTYIYIINTSYQKFPFGSGDSWYFW